MKTIKAKISKTFVKKDSSACRILIRLIKSSPNSKDFFVDSFNRLSGPRKRRRYQESISRDQGGDVVFFQTKAETARLSRPTRRQRDNKSVFRDRSGSGANFPFRVETELLSRPRRKRRGFPDQGGYGTTKKHFFATVVDAARFEQSQWRRPRPWRIRRDAP